MPRILVIDDDEQILKMFRMALERAGYEVETASNGDDGLKCYRRNRADLVITDIVMPEKEGLETIMDLKRECPDVKIFALSGGGRISPNGYLTAASRLGAFRTFTKPVVLGDILAAVQEALGES